MRALGLMSGTSFDGIDVGFLETDGRQSVRCLAGEFSPYDHDVADMIRGVMGRSAYDEDVREVEAVLTQKHAEAVQAFLKNHPAKIDVIGFHGQTLFHAPRKNGEKARTFQIGNGQMLANKTGIPVISQFRLTDVQAGGEGAPLVPVFQQALVQNAALNRAVIFLNIGGVSNLTYIREDHLAAFDVGPGNALLNDWVYSWTQEAYDKDGLYAAKGTVRQDLVRAFLEHPYFSAPPPKSLDRNTFRTPFEKGDMSLEDGAATLTAMAAGGIQKALEHLAEPAATWFVSGGGARNPVLMRQIQDIIAPASIHDVRVFGADPDFLEAYAFAYLAVRSRQGLPLSFPGTTGVPQPTSGGILSEPERE